MHSAQWVQFIAGITLLGLTTLINYSFAGRYPPLLRRAPLYKFILGLLTWASLYMTGTTLAVSAIAQTLQSPWGTLACTTAFLALTVGQIIILGWREAKAEKQFIEDCNQNINWSDIDS